MTNSPERTKRLLDIVLGIFLVLLFITTVVLILPAWRNYRKISADEELKRRELEAARRERNEYLAKRDRLQHSPAEVEKVAREKFNFTRKGEHVMSYPPGKTAPAAPPRKKR